MYIFFRFGHILCAHPLPASLWVHGNWVGIKNAINHNSQATKANNLICWHSNKCGKNGHNNHNNHPHIFITSIEKARLEHFESIKYENFCMSQVDDVFFVVVWLFFGRLSLLFVLYPGKFWEVIQFITWVTRLPKYTRYIVLVDFCVCLLSGHKHARTHRKYLKYCKCLHSHQDQTICCSLLCVLL